MSRLKLRPIVQINVMLLVIGFAVLTGWACSCYGGSDYQGNPQQIMTTRDLQADEGLVSRWHDFSGDNGTVNTKDVNYLRDWLQNGNLSIGLLVPQAPGALQPGSLVSDTASLYINYTVVGETEPHLLYIPMETDPATAQKMGALFSPPVGSQWQFMRPANFDWLSEAPTQTVNIANIQGSLAYQLDFHGADICNHCEVQLTGCSTRQFSFGEQVALKTLGLDRRLTANGELTCAEPIPTTILAMDNSGNLLPGPVKLSFGFWGGSVYTTTTTSDVAIPFALNHTDVTTRTVVLGGIQSEQGWNYAWQDLVGNPITQIDVGPLEEPLYVTYGPNIRLVGAGLPTCLRAQDNVTLSASLQITPTINVTTTTKVQVLPDEATCPTADVGIAKIASTDVISAGQSVTFTLTITNFESTPVNVIVTDTLSSAVAIGSVILPAGCTRNGAQITCNVSNVPGNGTATLEIVAQVANTFSGVLTNQAQVEPANAADAHFYDNIAGPVEIVVTGGVEPTSTPTLTPTPTQVTPSVTPTPTRTTSPTPTGSVTPTPKVKVYLPLIIR